MTMSYQGPSKNKQKRRGIKSYWCSSKFTCAVTVADVFVGRVNTQKEHILEGSKAPARKINHMELKGLNKEMRK